MEAASMEENTPKTPKGATDLARRWAALVADGRAEWRDGMCWETVDAPGEWPWGRFLDGEFIELDERNPMVPDCPVPDFDDPATLGCLLALVRLAWGDEYAQATADAYGRWRMVGRLDYAGLYGFATEAECLLAALETAPKWAGYTVADEHPDYDRAQALIAMAALNALKGAR